MKTLVAALMPLVILLLSLKLMLRTTFLSRGAWDVMVGVLARDFALWVLRLLGRLIALPFRMVAWLINQRND